MALDFRERGRWLARHVMPHEPMLRARLRGAHLYGLEIEDIIQEVYARIVSQPSLETILYPRQYMVQAANSIIIDHVRHSRVIPIHSTGDIEKLDIAAQEVGADVKMEFREEISQVATILASLPPRTSQILILRRVEGLSQMETAERLGISVKTVEKHLAIGVLELVKHFGRGGKFKTHTSKAGGKAKNDDDDQTASSGN